MYNHHLCQFCGKKIFHLPANDNKTISIDFDSLTFNDLELLRLRKIVSFRNNVHISHSLTCKAKK